MKSREERLLAVCGLAPEEALGRSAPHHATATKRGVTFGDAQPLSGTARMPEAGKSMKATTTQVNATRPIPLEFDDSITGAKGARDAVAYMVKGAQERADSRRQQRGAQDMSARNPTVPTSFTTKTPV